MPFTYYTQSSRLLNPTYCPSKKGCGLFSFIFKRGSLLSEGRYFGGRGVITLEGPLPFGGMGVVSCGGLLLFLFFWGGGGVVTFGFSIAATEIDVSFEGRYFRNSTVYSNHSENNK